MESPARSELGSRWDVTLVGVGLLYRSTAVVWFGVNLLGVRDLLQFRLVESENHMRQVNGIGLTHKEVNISSGDLFALSVSHVAPRG